MIEGILLAIVNGIFILIGVRWGLNTWEKRKKMDIDYKKYSRRKAIEKKLIDTEGKQPDISKDLISKFLKSYQEGDIEGGAIEDILSMVGDNPELIQGILDKFKPGGNQEEETVKYEG